MRVGVVGAGAWGTSLANMLSAKGEDVRLWTYEPEVAEEINSRRANSAFLPGITLDSGLKASPDLGEAVAGAEVVVMVTPSHVARTVAGRLAGVLPPDALVVSATKGIEEGSLLTMTGVLQDVLKAGTKERLAAISGPSFAREVALGLPTAVTTAAFRNETAETVQRLFWTEYFRVYTTADVIGVELGGALKNVMAIAAGIVQGLELGQNTVAAMITRGLAEMSRLGAKMGADPLTFSGLAGVGDLVLTCTSSQSRNQTVGVKLGQGQSLEEILKGVRTVAEGVRTTQSAHKLAQAQGVEMPICAKIYATLYEGESPRRALSELMARDPKLEHWGLTKS